MTATKNTKIQGAHSSNRSRNHSRFAGLAAVLPLGASFAAAPSEELREVIVVANRVAVTPDKIGNSVSVLDEAAIKESQAIIVSDLIARTPGVSFDRSGGPGTLTSVRIRGAEASQTLVLIDGVAVNDPSSPGAGYDFSSLLIGDISRIEILRGPQSTLYGSQAIGGVVNVVTREPAEGFGTEVGGEIGSDNTTLVKAAIGGREDKLGYRLAVGRYATDGTSAFAGGSETDPYRNTSVAGRVKYDFTDNVQLDLRTWFNQDKNHYDGYPPPNYVFGDEKDYALNRQFVGYAGVNFKLFDGRLDNRVAFQSTNARRNTFLDTGTAVFDTGRYEGENERYEYQGNFNIAGNYQLVFGLQNEQSSMTSDSGPSEASVRQKSAYAQLQAGLFKGFTLTLGERYDDHDTSGSHSTGQVAAAWSLASGTILRASWGEGFKSPSLYQLYSEYFGVDLQPEESTGWDAGIEQNLFDRRVNLSATYFSRDTDNQIAFVDCGFATSNPCAQPGHSFFGYYTNVNKTEAHGYELQATFAPTESLNFAANYTKTTVEDRSPGSANFGKTLPRRPETTANASVTYTWPIRLETGVVARYSGSSRDTDFDAFPSVPVTLDSYTLVDFRASFPVTDKFDVYGRVENAFDEEYATAFKYGVLGRAGYVGVNARF